MKDNKKIFDSVQLMRDIRESIYEMYKNNPELRKIELDRIRKEYGINQNTKLAT